MINSNRPDYGLIDSFVVCPVCNKRIRANTCNKNMFCDCCNILVNGNDEVFSVTAEHKKVIIVKNNPESYLTPEHELW